MSIRIIIENIPSVISGPTLPPTSSKDQNLHENSINLNHPERPQSTVDQNEKEFSNGIHPLYPTNDGRPSKGVQPLEKPQKKPTKGDKFPGPFAPSAADNPPNKFEFNNYEDEEEELGPQHRPHAPSTQNGSGPGPGFFNPTVNKNQYPDYDQSIFHNGQLGSTQQTLPNQKPSPYNPYLTQGGNGPPNTHAVDHQDKLPPELLNILGGNAQNIPPHLRIEHLLQQIQGNGAGDGDGQQHPSFGVQQQGNFPFGQHPNQPHILNLPEQTGQRPPQRGQGIFCLFCSSTFISVFSMCFVCLFRIISNFWSHGKITPYSCFFCVNKTCHSVSLHK